MRIFKMAIIMKDNGKKTYNMGKEFRNIRIETNIMVDLCAGVNLGKDNTNSQMEKYIMDHFIMGIVTVLEN